jgi:capsular polysaccharide biosynthesis protein
VVVLELKYYMNAIYKRMWMVILIPLVSVIATVVFTFFLMKPQYEATTTLYVVSSNYKTSAPIAYEDILISQQLVKDYRELIKSRSVTETVLDQLKITELTPDELSKKITVNLKNETRILEIKLVDYNPERAQILAENLSSVFISKIISLMNVENVDVIDHAEIPEDPVSPEPLVNILVALITGLFLSISTILILEYSDDTIKTTEDIEKQLGLTVLGKIPVTDNMLSESSREKAPLMEGVNEKKKEIVKEAYIVLKTNIQYCETEKVIKVITVTSYGPGEG